MNASADLKNYYEVLEIPVHAKPEEIYQCYLRAKTAYSSDSIALYSLMSPEECRNVLELIEEAYSILSDPNKRKRYDEARGLNRDFQFSQFGSSALGAGKEAGNHSLSRLLQKSATPNNSVNSAEGNRVASHEKYSSSETTSPGLNTSSLQPASSARNFESRASEHAVQTSKVATVATSSMTKLVTQKRFALDYILNADFEKEIEDAHEFSGDFLKKIREYKNLDIDRLSDMIKVSKLYIQGIEAEDFAKLPAPVYVRGFVFQYAKCLKLKPDLVANSYLARMKKSKP